MLIFSADTWFLTSLTDSYIPRRWNNTFFFWQLKYRDWSFWLSKIYNKNKYINSYAIYNGKVKGRLTRKVKYRHKQDVLPWCIQETLTEVSFLMSCSLKVTQYMHQPSRQLHSIWMSVPKGLYWYVVPRQN